MVLAVKQENGKHTVGFIKASEKKTGKVLKKKHS
jgi:hypothetical protein